MQSALMYGNVAASKDGCRCGYIINEWSCQHKGRSFDEFIFVMRWADMRWSMHYGHSPHTVSEILFYYAKYSKIFDFMNGNFISSVDQKNKKNPINDHHNSNYECSINEVNRVRYIVKNWIIQSEKSAHKKKKPCIDWIVNISK